MGCTWQEVDVVIHSNMLVSTQDDPWSAPAHFFQPHWLMLQHVHHDGSLMDLRIQVSFKTQLLSKHKNVKDQPLQHQTCGNKSAKKTSQAILQNTLTLTMALQSTLNLTLTFQNTLTLQETQTLTL